MSMYSIMVRHRAASLTDGCFPGSRVKQYAATRPTITNLAVWM